MKVIKFLLFLCLNIVVNAQQDEIRIGKNLCEFEVKPLIVIDDKITSCEKLKNFNADSIILVHQMTKEKAVKIYGEQGRNEAYIIKTKKWKEKFIIPAPFSQY